MINPEPLQTKIVDIGHRIQAGQFALDVLNGLSAEQKNLSSKYFYNERGSRLFEEIMNLPEYYLTNCEWDIFKAHKQDILAKMEGQRFQLVDLGAGDAKKTRVLLEHFYSRDADFHYVPIDINRDILEELEILLAQELPGLDTIPVVAEYFDALDWMRKNQTGRKLVLFMGSNIGNFNKTAARAFLSEMHKALEPGDLMLIGIDLKKDPLKILRAYDDSMGITAQFNLNLLQRINDELGADFDIPSWKHYASYNPLSGAVESFLISQKKQDVFARELNKTFSFEAFEAIHTEYSYKYTLYEIAEMAKNCGFELIENLTCPDTGFIDSIWRVL
jgi:L-histidine N-alpha-methyltransferase